MPVEPYTSVIIRDDGKKMIIPVLVEILLNNLKSFILNDLSKISVIDLYTGVLLGYFLFGCL